MDAKFNVSSWGYRHQQSLVLLCAMTIAYSMRSCMGAALVAMTRHDPNIRSNGTANVSEFKMDGLFNMLMLRPPYPTFNWSKKVQDAVLASFFWGYTLLQIIAGQLAHRFGSRYLLSGAMLINCIASLMIPHAAYYGGWISMAVLRFIQGFGQACFFPATQTFFGKWAPLEERGRLTSITYGGIPVGAAFGLIVTGLIATTYFGWPGIFRFYGIVSAIASGLLWFLIADSPAKHSKISPAERRYIEDRLGLEEGVKKKRQSVPWSKILSHPGLYAITIGTTGYAWGHVILYSEIPAFMDNIMGVDIKTNGLLTAIPFIVMWFTYYILSWLTDMLIVKKILSVTNTRKLAFSIGSLVPALGFIGLALMPKNIYMVETVLVLIGAVRVMALSVVMVNQIDISPNFAGTMMSISNCVANIGCAIAPLVAGFILTDVKSEYLWRYVFFISAGIYTVTSIVFVIFGSAERAEWDDPDNMTREEGLQMLGKENSNVPPDNVLNK